MIKEMKSFFLPLVSFVLAIISLITLKSIAPDLVAKQALFFALGAGVFFAMSQFRLERWAQLSPIIYSVLSIVLLTLLVVGRTTRGIRGWIPLFGGFKLQPSQFGLLAVLPLVGLVSPRLKFSSWSGIFKFLGLVLLPAVLIVLEPDVGTGFVYLVAAGSLLFFLPISWKKIALLSGGAVLAGLIIWLVGLKPYQKQRITSFFNQQDQVFVRISQLDSTSYNSRQALIAVGSGKTYGRGLGFGVQSHLKFLPERQTDFIFASFAEEWGFVGSSLLILLYASLTVFIFSVASNSKANSNSQAASFYCLGIGLMFLVQTMINIGMNLGIVPITGITLPLLSYGGSSIIAVMASLGLVQSVVNNQQPTENLRVE
ncbi:MAG: hypothetical protein GF381_03300 [Candidatus Pacebacteria bacterium]|nr:hypothetical protein [Candidatus Paceibacterota bacterium]